MTPRRHQAEAIAFCQKTLNAGHARCLVQMPTGSGKSFVIRQVAKDWLKRGGSVYVLCPTEEIIQQQRLDSLREGMTPVIEKAELHASRFARYVLGTPQTMWRRFEKYRRDKMLMLIDECHHFHYEAPVNCKIASVFERVIGFSATPWSLGCLEFFESRLHVYPLSMAIRERVNCAYSLNEWEDPTPGQYQIIYCSSFDDIKQMCARIAPSDYAVHQERSARQTISRFRFGKLGTIVVNRMLTEGFDQPQIKRVWIARGTGSEIFALQMAGRALREYQGKQAEIFIQSEKTQETLRLALERAG